MSDGRKDDLAKGILCIFVVPVLLFGVGYLVLAVLGGMNTPAAKTVVNVYTEPLAVGETWQQEGVLELTVTAVQRIDWSDQRLAELSAETRQAYQEEDCQAYDVIFSVKNTGYHGYFSKRKLRPGLLVSASAQGMRQDETSTALLPKYGDDVFGWTEMADGSRQGLGIGEEAEENHFIIFVEKDLAGFDVIFSLMENETLEQIEARSKAGDTTRHVYEMTYHYQLPAAGE